MRSTASLQYPSATLNFDTAQLLNTQRSCLTAAYCSNLSVLLQPSCSLPTPLLQVASVKLGQEASEAAAAAVLEARATGASEEEVKVGRHCTLHPNS